MAERVVAAVMVGVVTAMAEAVVAEVMGAEAVVTVVVPRKHHSCRHVSNHYSHNHYSEGMRMCNPKRPHRTIAHRLNHTRYLVHHRQYTQRVHMRVMKGEVVMAVEVVAMVHMTHSNHSQHSPGSITKSRWPHQSNNRSHHY